MGSRNEYSYYARQCADAAARATDESHRQFMLDMAETLRRLATGDSPAHMRSRESPHDAGPDSRNDNSIQSEAQHHI
jgi:hypothetical protein